MGMHAAAAGPGRGGQSRRKAGQLPRPRLCVGSGTAKLSSPPHLLCPSPHMLQPFACPLLIPPRLPACPADCRLGELGHPGCALPSGWAHLHAPCNAVLPHQQQAHRPRRAHRARHRARANRGGPWPCAWRAHQLQPGPGSWRPRASKWAGAPACTAAPRMSASHVRLHRQVVQRARQPGATRCATCLGMRLPACAWQGCDHRAWLHALMSAV